MNVKRINLILY